MQNSSHSCSGAKSWLYRLVTLAALGMAGAAVAQTGAPPPSSDRLKIDLADGVLPRLEEVETSYIPFKDKLAYHCLLDGWRTRWWEQISFLDMLWATSVQASIEVKVFAPADRTLVLRMAPYEGSNPKLPAQKIGVLWNRVRLGECVFDKKDGWTLKEFRFRVPASIQDKGKNTISFVSRYSVSPLQLDPKKFADKPKEGRDPMAFGLDSLRLVRSGGAATETPGTEPQPDFARTAGSFEDKTITQAGSTRIVIPVKLPSSKRCVFSLASAAAQGNVAGDITLRWDTLSGPQEKLLARYPIAPGAKGGAVEVDVSEASGTTAEVVFDTTSSQDATADANLVWTAPELHVDVEPVAPQKQNQQQVEMPHAENVLFILLDACRADSLGCYGYSRDTTPFIDTLARDGIVFQRAFSAAPYTYSSTWSLYTSLYPFQHGAPMVPRRPADTLPTLQKTLRAAGIITGFSCGNPWSFDTGMANGFDEFLPAYEHIFTKNPPVRTPGGVTHRSIDFMFRHRKERFFLYAHYMLPHEPYLPPAPYLNRFTVDLANTLPATAEAMWPVNYHERGITREELYQLRARYDENLLSVDAEVAQLCQALTALGLADKTLIIITADHGESFMEHGVLSHNLTVYNEVTRIPMILTGPMIKSRAGQRPARIVRNVDFYPTICDVMGVKPPETLEGHNLLVNRPEDDGIQAYSEATYDRHPLEAYWWPRYKLIRDDYSAKVEVYDLTTDAGELSNRAASEPVLTDYLLAVARRWKEEGAARSATPNEDVIISPEISKQLHSAGYLGY